MATKANSKPGQTSEMEFFCKMFPGTVTNSEPTVTKENLFKIFFNQSICNQMPLIVMSVDSSGVAAGKQRGTLASNNHC